MTRKTLFQDRRGTTAVEFAITLPVVILMFFGLWQTGYGMWWQFGLQHGAQMAARCMTINRTICSDIPSAQSYAASQSYGLNPSPSIFKLTTPAPACGNQFTADFTVSPVVANIGIPAFTLHAEACFAT